MYSRQNWDEGDIPRFRSNIESPWFVCAGRFQRSHSAQTLLQMTNKMIVGASPERIAPTWYFTYTVSPAIGYVLVGLQAGLRVAICHKSPELIRHTIWVSRHAFGDRS